MATVTVTLQKDAYECLARQKRHGESFSDVVLRLAGRPEITGLAGLLTEEEAREVEAEIADLRKRSRKRADRLVKEFNDL